jgi:indolepyruvate ferredoxin oxidoreductase
MDYALTDRYLRQEGTVYLTGVQALVRVLFDLARHDRAQGLSTATFVSGYEGSPLGGYDLEIGRQAGLLGELDVVHRPGLNEELAATAVMGSQIAGETGQLRPDGVSGVWYGKSPGLDRASDALRHANLIGTDPRGGAVVLAGDDPAAKSSTVPCVSEGTLAGLAIPALYPADPQDVLDLGLHAHYLSRFTGLWSGLKITTAVADGAGTVRVHPDRVVPRTGDAGPGTHRPSARLLGPNLVELERSLHAIRLPRALEYARLNPVNRIASSAPGDRVGIIAAGKTYLDVREALTLLGLDEAGLRRNGIRVLKLGMIWPVEPEIIGQFADGLDELIVVEEKRAFLETSVKEILYARAARPAVHGKLDARGHALFPSTGELDADSVAAGLARAFDRLDIDSVREWRNQPRRERSQLPLLARSPYFCSGCPHNSSTKADEGALVGGGIGCHAMVLFMPQEQVGNVVGLTQMGGEGAQWIGMAPFVDEPHFIQNLGDGTFWHSGSLAVRASVAAGVNVTYKLLYNSAVAMTGGQDPVGGMSLPGLVRLLQAEGAAKIVVTSDDPARTKAGSLPRAVEVRHRDDVIDVQRELAKVPGVTVLIHDQECAAEKRRKRRRGKAVTPAAKVMINERICEGCGDCGAKSNCLSVHPVATEFGRKTRIHQASCNVDYSCLEGDCPSFVTVVPKPGWRLTALPPVQETELPAPVPAVGAGQFRMRITGIGGTGIVTVAQILATAAVLNGREVRGLDQTGLAQKGGAVVSDLTITSAPAELAAKLGRSRCDLYLGCDGLVATDPAYLAAADPGRTTAVVSTTEVPTGRMVTDTSVDYPTPGAVRSAVDAASERAVYLNAGSIAGAALGDDQYANLVLVGAAYQSGALPLDADVIEQAITLNGVSVAANVQAFRLGRLAVADPDKLHAALGQDLSSAASVTRSAAAERLAAETGVTDGSDLRSLLVSRIADLVSYQDEGYARGYAEFVVRVRAAEAAASAGAPGSAGPTGSVGEGGGEVTETVARNLHKLMAYKDEYEIARLALDPAFRQQVDATFGPGGKVSYRLHPPLLRAMGLQRKIALGRWFDGAFVTLRAMRRVRGSRADIFGYSRMRRLERELIAEYRASIEAALPLLRPDTQPLVVAIAALPDLIRGYEGVKLANVERYRAELESLRAQLSAAASSVPVA